jgi:hypothetical protein
LGWFRALTKFITRAHAGGLGVNNISSDILVSNAPGLQPRKLEREENEDEDFEGLDDDVDLVNNNRSIFPPA